MVASGLRRSKAEILPMTCRFLEVFTVDVQDFESLRGARAFPMPLHLA